MIKDEPHNLTEEDCINVEKVLDKIDYQEIIDVYKLMETEYGHKGKYTSRATIENVRRRVERLIKVGVSRMRNSGELSFVKDTLIQCFVFTTGDIIFQFTPIQKSTFPKSKDMYAALKNLLDI